MNTVNIPPVIASSVRVSLNRWDVLRCRLWVVAHNRKLVAIVLVMCIAVPALNYHTPEGIRFPLVYCAFYFVIATTLMFVLNVALQILFQTFWLFANKNRGVVGEHEFVIRDDGLVEKTSFNESLHRWAGFHKIAASRKCLFVFVTDSIVHYIPLRAFASKEDADAAGSASPNSGFKQLLFMDPDQPFPRKLQIAVISSIVILILGFGEFLMQLLPIEAIGAAEWVLLPGGIVVFGAGLCGAYCGLSLVFRLKGFPRLVSVMSTMVSLYAIIQCAGFYRWAIGLP